VESSTVLIAEEFKSVAQGTVVTNLFFLGRLVVAHAKKAHIAGPINAASLTMGIFMLLSKLLEGGVDKQAHSLFLFGKVDLALVKVITGKESFDLGSEIVLVTPGEVQLM
jgi:hypothetical protein